MYFIRVHLTSVSYCSTFEAIIDMKPKLYHVDMTPPCRAVYMAAAALKIDLEKVEINLLEAEHLKPEFIKINPQHTVPTLDDNGTIIWDSHAINIYLVSKYGKDDSLYPSEYKKRSIINQRLFFDAGLVYPAVRRIAEPIIFHGFKMIPENLIEEGHKTYAFFEIFLENNEWAAGDSITLADFSLIADITSLDILIPIDANKYPNIASWIKRAQQLPYYSVNQEGVDKFRNHIKKLLDS